MDEDREMPSGTGAQILPSAMVTQRGGYWFVTPAGRPKFYTAGEVIHEYGPYPTEHEAMEALDALRRAS